MNFLSEPAGEPPIETLEDFKKRVAADLAPKPVVRFPLARFDTIKPDPSASYLVKGLLSSSGLAIVWGAPKCGKSFWTYDLLMHVALGWEYRGRRVRQGPIVYCALEGAQGFRNRVEAFRVAKLAEAIEADVPFYLMSAPLSLVADQARLVADIRAQLGASIPVAVCVDTLNRSIAGSENDDEAMGAYVRASDAIREAFGCLVLVVHHSGYSADRPRGHSSLVGALDVQIGIKRDPADNIVAELELSKDGAVGLQIVSRLDVIEIGVDQDGDVITSCVVMNGDTAASADRPKAAKGPNLPKSAQVALQAFDKAVIEAGEAAPASNHIPVAARVVTVDRWREYALRMGISKGEDRAQRKAFQSAAEALIAASVVAVWEPYAWRKDRNFSEPY